MTDQELEQEVDRLMDELISVVDGQHAMASDIALCEVMAAGCTDAADCQRLMGMVIEALSARLIEVATGMEVLH